jgi:GDPmannose 4,6-dehydratase
MSNTDVKIVKNLTRMEKINFMGKKALIIGVSGQDGAFLSQLLLDKGYEVHGSSRDAQTNEFEGLKSLGIKENVSLHSLNTSDFKNVLQILNKVKPDEIYNLSGQSSVGLSFEQPVETFESIAVATLNILEAIRLSSLPVRFYNAGSGECFGETPTTGATEVSAFSPFSPYATAKATSFWQVANYRKFYGLYCCTGILFNHESYFRSSRFVTQKIIRSVSAIARGSREKLVLGNLDIYRDWGWAPEYVEAMWLMLQQNEPQDFIVATGKSHSLAEFIDKTFKCFDLKIDDHLIVDKNLFRPSDIKFSLGNPRKAKDLLGWQAKIDLDGIISRMIEFTK